jgi:hypothetical protein
MVAYELDQEKRRKLQKSKDFMKPKYKILCFVLQNNYTHCSYTIILLYWEVCITAVFPHGILAMHVQTALVWNSSVK